ncbi:MAG: hypothetical protein H0V33_01035 [Acidimicrobiia bacterium]|nr:hypothetical protein [Acidimicrobiia bacterium]
MAKGWAVLLAALALGACGDVDGAEPVDAVESGLAAVVADRLELMATDVVVTCPREEGDVAAGAELACVVAVGAGEDVTTVTVPLAIGTDGEVVLRSAVVPSASAEAYLAGELAVAAGGPVEVGCGTGALLVVAVDSTFGCAATRADGGTFTVTVTVETLDGAVRYEVEPVCRRSPARC